MVDGNRVIALRARYRIALNFPDTTMAGEHGFTKIMTAPWGSSWRWKPWPVSSAKNRRPISSR